MQKKSPLQVRPHQVDDAVLVPARNVPLDLALQRARLLDDLGEGGLQVGALRPEACGLVALQPAGVLHLGDREQLLLQLAGQDVHVSGGGGGGRRQIFVEKVCKF